VIISLIWLEADSPLVSVTPRILRVVTQTMPGIGRGGFLHSVFPVVHEDDFFRLVSVKF